MKLNYFIFIGLILRYLYYWSNDTYTMDYFKTKLWKTIVFSFVVTCVFWYISFLIDLSMFNDWWHKAFISISYVFIGWSVDSVFLALMKILNSKFNNMVQEKSDNNV